MIIKNPYKGFVRVKLKAYDLDVFADIKPGQSLEFPDDQAEDIKKQIEASKPKTEPVIEDTRDDGAVRYKDTTLYIKENFNGSN